MFQTKSGKPKTRTIFLSLALMSIIVISFVSLIGLPISNAVSPFLQAEGAQSSSQTLSFSVSYPLNVKQGDALIVSFSMLGGTTVSIPVLSDTLGDNFNQLIYNSTATSNTGSYAGIYNTTAKSSGANTVTITASSIVFWTIVIFEMNGQSRGNPTVSSLGSPVSLCTPCFTKNTQLNNGFTLSEATSGSTALGTFTATPGFTLIFNGAVPDMGGNAQYDSGNIGSSTLPMDYTDANTPWVEVAATWTAFTPLIITTTETQTITGWVFPNFIDGQQTFSWVFVLGIMIFPVAFISELAYQDTKGGGINLDGKSPIFLTLMSLFIGSIIGVFTNLIPVLFPFLIGIILAIYIWRGS